MDLEGVERCATELRAGEREPGSVVDDVLPALTARPRLVRTRALEVATMAAERAPEKSRAVVESLRAGLDADTELTTHEIETLDRIAGHSPRAMADCVQPLVSAITGDGASDRAAAAATVLATIAAGEPGLLQGAVRPLVDGIDADSQSGRDCAWALRRLDTAEPAVTRPAVADAVWTLQDGDDTAKRDALYRLAQLGRIVPERIPDPAMDEIAALTSAAEPAIRAAAVTTLAAIGGRPPEPVLELDAGFDDGNLYTGIGSGETDKLLRDSLRLLGTAAFDRVTPYLDSLESAIVDPAPEVRAAALDAVRALGRERPAWLRSIVDDHRAMRSATERSVRRRFVSALQVSVRGACNPYREQAATDLLRALGDGDVTTVLRAVAGLRALLEARGDQEVPVLRAGAVRDALLARLLTSDGNLLNELVDSVLHLDQENVIEITSGEIAVVLDRFQARLADPETATEDVDGLAHFLAEVTGEIEMARELIERAPEAEFEIPDELDTAPVFRLLVENASDWAGDAALWETLASAYIDPEAFDADEFRTDIVEAFLDAENPDRGAGADLLRTLVDELEADSSPYWKTADGIKTIEALLARHPHIAEECRAALYEMAVDTEKRGVVGFRLLGTACLAAPPAEEHWRRRLEDQLDTPERETASHAWLAGAVLVCSADPQQRAYAKRRLLSAIAQGEAGPVADVVERICTTVGTPPPVVVAELAVTEPKRALEALTQSPPPGQTQQEIVTEVLRSLPSHPPGSVRAVFEEYLGSTTAVDTVPPAVLTEYSHVLLRFGSDALRESVLCQLQEQADECGREGLTVDAATLAAAEALRRHPVSRIRKTAASLHDRLDDETRSAGMSRSTGVAGSRAANDTRPAALETRLLEPVAVRRLRDELVTTATTPSAAVIDSLKRTARDGAPPAAAAALRTLRTLLRAGRVDWDRIDGVVVTQLTDPHRLVRQIAARGLLTAAHLGDLDGDRPFVVDRLSADTATSGILARLLALSPPAEWHAPSVAANALIKALFESPTAAQRHACGVVFRRLVNSAPAQTRAAVDSGLDLLDDGKGHALSAYHLLLAFGDQIEYHGRLVGSHDELVSAMISNALQTGMPGDWGPDTGFLHDEATVSDPIELATVWRAALRVAAVGGLPVYKRALDPPDELTDTDLVTVDSVRSFLRNASEQPVDKFGEALLQALSQSQLDRLVSRWTSDAFAPSTELARREVSLLPTFAAVDERADQNSHRYLDLALAAAERDDEGVRKVAIEALSDLTEQGLLSARAFTSRLIAHVDDPSGWVRRRVAEELAAHVSEGHLSGSWLLRWAEGELTDPVGLEAQTAAMAMGALGAEAARHRRDCLALVETAYETGQPILDSRLLEAASRLVEASPGLADRCDIGREQLQAVKG
jgi:hypothetical protein